MAGEREFRTDITANTQPLTEAMQAAVDKVITDSQRMQSAFRETSQKMSDSIRESFAKMNTTFDSVAESVHKFRGALAAAAAVALGGGMFGKLASDAATSAIATDRLASMLGTTMEKATALKIALGEIGVDTDSYTTMISKMTMKLREGEARFNELGIATRDSNGQLLDTEKITANALGALQNFKAGTDRNLASTETFGRGWNEVIKLMRLTPETIEAARKKAIELGLSIGPEAVEAAHAYEKAHADLKFAIEAVGKATGEQMLPQLTATTTFMAEQGPQMAETFKTALSGVGFVAGAVWLTLKDMGDALGAIAAEAAAVASGNLLQAAAIYAARDEQAQKNETEYERMKAMFGGELPASAGTGASAPDGGGGNRPYTNSSADKSRMSGWETELAAQRDAEDKKKLEQGSFQTFTLAMERDFWKKILDTESLTKDERAAVSRKYYAAEAQLRKQAFDAEIADIKAKIAQHKQGSVERIQLAGDAAAKIGEKYGLESKEYKEALAEMTKMAQERYTQQQKLEQMALDRTKESKVAAIELERQALDDAENLGLIHADQKLARLKQLKELEYQIELQAENDKAAIYDLDEVAYQQHLDKIAQLKEKHAADVAKIDGQIAVASKKSLDAWLDPIGNGFKTLMDGMIQGTQTWHQAIRKTLLAVGQEYLATGVKIAIDWAKQEILKTQATTAGIVTRGAAEKAGASQSILLTAWTAIKSIGIKAWEAAASVYASIASIPVIGPILAPGMAIAAAGTVLSFVGKIASAEGGFSIPRGLNPVTQLHQEEMVLPAHLANAVRAMAEGGGGAAGAGDTHLHVHAWDSRDVKRFLIDNKSAVADAVKSAYRDGKR